MLKSFTFATFDLLRQLQKLDQIQGEKNRLFFLILEWPGSLRPYRTRNNAVNIFVNYSRDAWKINFETFFKSANVFTVHSHLIIGAVPILS